MQKGSGSGGSGSMLSDVVGAAPSKKEARHVAAALALEQVLARWVPPPPKVLSRSPGAMAQYGCRPRGDATQGGVRGPGWRITLRWSRSSCCYPPPLTFDISLLTSRTASIHPLIRHPEAAYLAASEARGDRGGARGGGAHKKRRKGQTAERINPDEPITARFRSAGLQVMYE